MQIMIMTIPVTKQCSLLLYYNNNLKNCSNSTHYWSNWLTDTIDKYIYATQKNSTKPLTLSNAG